MRITIIVLIAVILSTNITYASENTNSKTAVLVDAQCSEDSVGTSLVYRIKEGIRRSESMYLETEYMKSYLQLLMVCLIPDSDNRGDFTQYSYTITLLNASGYYDYQVTFGVSNCGVNRVAGCAESRLANLDNAIDDIRKKIRDGQFLYRN